MSRKTTKNATKVNIISSQCKQIEEHENEVYKLIAHNLCPSDFGLNDSFTSTECRSTKGNCEVCWHRSFINCGGRRISREAWK